MEVDHTRVGLPARHRSLDGTVIELRHEAKPLPELCVLGGNPRSHPSSLARSRETSRGRWRSIRTRSPSEADTGC
jgi:hypothetical protein